MFRLFIIFFCSLATLFAESHKFTVITIPKCGTHLIIPMISKMIGYTHETSIKDNPAYFSDIEKLWDKKVFYAGHYPLPKKKYIDGLKKRNYKVIFLIRDLRSQLISLYHWFAKHNIPEQPDYWDLPLDEQLIELMTAKKKLYGPDMNLYREHILNALPWADIAKQDPNFCCIVKYEDLVGPLGGGSRKAQKKSILKIARHLGIPFTHKQVNELIAVFEKEIYGQGETFRSGKIGKWDSELSPRVKTVLKEFTADFLVEHGYVENSNW